MEVDFLGKQVVVTGATGELGVAVVRALVTAGAICELPVRSPSAAEPLVREFGAAARLHEVRIVVRRLSRLSRGREPATGRG